MSDGTPFLRVAADRIGAPGSPAKMPFRATNAANWSSIIRIGAKMAVIRRRIARRAVSSHTQRAGRVPYGESRLSERYRTERKCSSAMESKTKHLEMIQGVINRLSTNSFLLKGWSVVLVSALFALSAGDSNPAFIFLAYIPALVFWGLDGYFLSEERKFRKLYDRVRTLDEPAIDFSMDTTPVTAEAGDWWNATWSKTLIPFHGVLILAIIVVMALTIFSKGG